MRRGSKPTKILVSRQCSIINYTQRTENIPTVWIYDESQKTVVVAIHTINFLDFEFYSNSFGMDLPYFIHFAIILLLKMCSQISLTCSVLRIETFLHMSHPPCRLSHKGYVVGIYCEKNCPTFCKTGLVQNLSTFSWVFQWW